MDTAPLQRLGLQESDVKIYLSLLSHGLSTATQISQYTGLNRSHTYDKLDLLLEKGLISFVIKNNVKYFQASAPEKILDYISEMQKDIQIIIPDLAKLQRSNKTKTIVELYQGKEGMKTVFKDILREKKDYFVLGEEGKFQEILPVFIQQFLRDVPRLGMKEHLLSKESKRGSIAMTPKNSRIKYLPDEILSPSMSVIYGNKTAVFIWSDPLFAILIKDKDVARSFKSYFDVLWRIAKT
ncbi:MAG TPA: helix-turn-helix domain-containing protein [Candidatus Nanoarchaeia archaeon]|nr:helix-turn-helix domain-containing protein [Candidatus Nanoarchaeia archaeon]